MNRRPTSGTPGPISSLGRASGIVLSGNVLGFAVLLVSTPIVARLYSPELYGEFAAIVATASVLIGFSTLRLEILAQTAADDKESANLFGNAIVFSLILALVASLGVLGLHLVFGYPLLWAAGGLVILLGSLQLVGSALMTRRQKYTDLAAAGFFQQAGTGILQAIFGSLGGGVLGLIAGFCVARAVWLVPIGAQLRNGFDQFRMRSEVLSKGRLAGSSALINSVGGQLIVLIPAAAYGALYAGLAAMATRLLVSPLSLISTSVASASIGEVGRALREGRAREAATSVRSGVLILAALGALPCGLIIFAGGDIFAWVLGDQWRGAGQIASAMALGAWAQFALVPFSQVLNLTGASSSLFKWDIARLLILAGSLSLPLLPSVAPVVGFWAYSISQVALYGYLYMVIRASLKRVARNSMPREFES